GQGAPVSDISLSRWRTLASARGSRRHFARRGGSDYRMFNSFPWVKPARGEPQPPCLQTGLVCSRGPASATVRATKFPCIEYVFYFVEISSSATVINQMSQMVLLAVSKPMTTYI